jgi:hypothetical protein
MKNSRLLSRVSAGVAFTALGLFLTAACGDSKNDDAVTAPSGAAGTTATGSLQPGAAGAGNGNAGGTNEGAPVIVALDPDRDTTTPVNLGETGAVACGGGGDFCVGANPTCCTVAGAGGGGMNNNTFSCAASTADCPANTVSSASCSSQLSCDTGQVCCRVANGAPGAGGPGGGGTTATCEAACAAGAAQLCLDDAECGAGNVCGNNNVCAPPPCTADSCGAGEVCCRGMGGGGAAAPACAVPEADGLCPAGRLEVCTDATTCPADNTCSPLFGGGFGNGGGGGGALVCTPPPCTPTSCAVGEVCCVGGAVGGNPTCAAASDTGECNGNSRLVCITDAECAPSAGTACLLAPNGGGSLSCRLPPPAPPSDAGVVDVDVADAG